MRYSLLLFSILVAMIFYLSFQNSKKETNALKKADIFKDKSINKNNSSFKIDESAYYRENYSTKKVCIDKVYYYDY